MAQRMTQAEFDRLLQQYPKLAYGVAGQREIDNPEYLALPMEERIAQKKGFTDRVIPEKISVPIYQWQSPDVLIQAHQDPSTGEWNVEKNVPDITPTLPRKETPEQDTANEEKAKEARVAAEWNRDHGPRAINPDTGQEYGASAPGSGLYETHEQRAARELNARQGALAEESNQRARDAEQRAQAAVERQAKLDAEKAATDARQAENEKQRIELERQRVEREKATAASTEAGRQETARLEREKFEREKELANRPKPLGTPSDTEANVAVWNPATGQMESVANPVYDRAKVEAARLKDQLSTAIALNQISAQQAAQKYKEWWDTNVTLPFQQAQEMRARAAEQRAALEAEDRRKQFASQFSLQSADLGFRAGNAAVQNEISLLPYRAGPTEAADMSSAINSLGAGGKVYGPDASAGIHFQASDFEFDRPDFEGIASKATANALKHLTSYKPSGKFSSGDYSGITMPTGQGAPSSTGGGIDTSSLWQQYQQMGIPAYTGPQDDEPKG
jgi:hypothetical protein